MSIECTEYQFNSIKAHTVNMNVNNSNIIQRANNLITECQQLQKDSELTINKMIFVLSEIIEIASKNDFARIKIEDILNDFKQEVNK